MSKKNPNRGSSFDDFLKEEDVYEETKATALKRVVAWQLQEAMAKEHMSKNQMAKRMRTSRTQLDRILDPENCKVQLDSLMKAAAVLGREFKLDLV